MTYILEVDVMKKIFLFFFFFILFHASLVIPAQTPPAITAQEQQAALRVLINFLLHTSHVPVTGIADPGDPPNPVITGNELISTVDGIIISVAGAGGTQILVKTSSGELLFNLSKISPTGAVLKAQAGQWSCLQENTTGLIWEMKTSDNGLHDQKDSFSWNGSTFASARNAARLADNSATCSGYVAGDPATYCNTQAFVARVNAQSLCGASNWRMPTLSELDALFSLNNAAPALYETIFARGTDKALWSSTSVPGFPNFSWHIYANDADKHGADQSGNLPVLLVRSTQP